jgi:hypothetical protein
MSNSISLKPIEVESTRVGPKRMGIADSREKLFGLFFFVENRSARGNGQKKGL